MLKLDLNLKRFGTLVYSDLKKRYSVWNFDDLKPENDGRTSAIF